ncbi:MAG: nucleoside deaminase [Holophagaceae bacterium]|nr:nucleoside deaminase [Holophagaceae bacterium]
MWSSDDLYFMRLALEEAELAARRDEVPIGAILVVEGQAAGRGHNSPVSLHDPSAHAEIQALRDAAGYLRNYRLGGATLYVTLEPCLMCFGALIHARVARVVYGASDPKVGVSSLLPALEGARLNHAIDFKGGLLEPDCRAQLQAFFKAKRGQS